MTIIDKYEYPDELLYTRDHVWVKVEGATATIGLTQFGQSIAGDILFVEAPNPGREVTKDTAFMSMESGKWVGRVKSPISGKIMEANSELEWDSNLVNSDPYGQGWLTKIELSDPAELDTLLHADSTELATFITEEKAKFKK